MSKKTQKIWSEIYKNGLFVISIVAIILLLPTTSLDPFQFEIGKPWQNDLLTAPFDFPIYKTSNDLAIERRDIETSASYFDFDSTVYNSEIENLTKLENKLKSEYTLTKEDSIALSYIRTKLKDIYNNGIISVGDMKVATSSKDSTIMLKRNMITSAKSVENIYSPTSAFAELKKNLPANISTQWLSLWKIESYITPNVIYDANTTNMVKTERINNISISEGMVQMGERIIDRGDIVTEEKAKILNSLSKEKDIKQGQTFNERSKLLIGRSLLIVCLMVLFYVYLRLFRKQYYNSKRIVTLLLLMIVAFCGGTSLLITYASPALIYIIPFAILPIIVSTFFDTRTALYANYITIFISSIVVPSPFEFVLLQATAGMVTVSTLRDLSQRSQLVRTVIFIICSYCLFFLGYGLTSDSSIFEINWINFVFFAINGLLLLFAYPLIYIIEQIFGFISNVRLIELSDINTPLMRKLSETAPGTFQHCTQVSNLAVEIANKIGANPLLARAGALYHDVGKISNPPFFVENQAKGNNPHDKLNAEESSIIITNHVKDGVKIAKDFGLPKSIIEFIETHHGKSVTRYFYNQYVNEHPDEDVNIEKFSYIGPNPYTKEQAIVMICDAVEAASRSLPEYNDESINKLVDKIVDTQVIEHYLDRAPITLKELGEAKEILKEKLKNIYHTRIAYPEIKK
ncbi:MAG: HDIG domain-containing protein [Paludibacteraceae bacterium]|nr:HDIG domain-containing protein [Paludibacteraceae bacterium]